jgi:hypothetical protein
MPFKGCRYPKICPLTITQNIDGSETETKGIGLVFGKATSIEETVNAAPVNFYADDALTISDPEFTDGTLKVGLDDLTNTAESTVLGRTITEDGWVEGSGDDNPPYCIFSWVVPIKLSTGSIKYRLMEILRTMFEPVSGTYKSKEKSVTLTGPTINGTFMLNAERKYERHKDFDTVTQALATQIQDLNIPNTYEALACTPIPANEATDIAVGTDITLTFNNAIDHGNAILVKTSDDTIIAATKTFDGTKKILTINPTADLSASTEYAIIITNMTDAFGQTLADTVYKFTTAV